MLFHSQIFLLLFLPLTIIGYYGLASRRLLRIWWLILASFVFYGFWDIRLIPLLAGSIVVNWFLSRLHTRFPSAHITAIGVAANLALLAAFKYTNFLADSFAWLGGWEHRDRSIVLPLAIRFFTFQQVSYIADLGRGKAPLYRFDEFALGASFANLSMNSATAFEQSQLFTVFIRHHPTPKFVLFGVDPTVWCLSKSDRFTPRPFPPWMYDDDPWNDLLNLFNAFTFEQAGRQLGYLLGLRAPKYGNDGYTRFVPPKSEYDLVRARAHIYQDRPPGVRPPIDPEVIPTAAQRAGWTYDTHHLMAEMINRLPAETVKILLFVPYHQALLPVPGSLQQARRDHCKWQLTALTSGTANSHVLDFMIRSKITMRDENYWDAGHYSVDIAALIAQLIPRAIETRRGRPGYFRYLNPN